MRRIQPERRKALTGGSGYQGTKPRLHKREARGRCGFERKRPLKTTGEHPLSRTRGREGAGRPSAKPTAAKRSLGVARPARPVRRRGVAAVGATETGRVYYLVSPRMAWLFLCLGTLNQSA